MDKQLSNRYNIIVIAAIVGLTSAATPTDVYKRSLDGLVLIANQFPDGHYVFGSGYVADTERRLVVTSHHVMGAESTASVYFPTHDENDKVILDKQYYLDHVDELTRVAGHSVGRVVARDRRRDLAVLAVGRLSPAVHQLLLADHDPRDGDTLCILGNPADRDLWRLSIGKFSSAGSFSNTFADGYHVNFHAVFFASDTFPGNSGGPILNDDAEVVGIDESVGGDGGFETVGVHRKEISSILQSIKIYRIISIENQSDHTITFQVRWGGGDWDSNALDPGFAQIFYSAGSDVPWIRYDCSRAGGYQERRYALDYYTAYLGRGVAPHRARDAMEYGFLNTSIGVDLFKQP